MGWHSVQKFFRLGHEIEIIRDSKEIPGELNPEGHPTFEVRYGLMFDGQMTNWSGFVRATEDERSAIKISGLGRRRALRLGLREEPAAASPAD